MAGLWPVVQSDSWVPRPGEVAGAIHWDWDGPCLSFARLVWPRLHYRGSTMFGVLVDLRHDARTAHRHLTTSRHTQRDNHFQSALAPIFVCVEFSVSAFDSTPATCGRRYRFGGDQYLSRHHESAYAAASILVAMAALTAAQGFARSRLSAALIRAAAVHRPHRVAALRRAVAQRRVRQPQPVASTLPSRSKGSTAARCSIARRCAS